MIIWKNEAGIRQLKDKSKPDEYYYNGKHRISRLLYVEMILTRSNFPRCRNNLQEVSVQDSMQNL